MDRDFKIVTQPSSIHGQGVVAGSFIPRGERIVEYVGQVISKAESQQGCENNNQFIFALNDHEDIDGNVSWNPARFINHSCEPNADAEFQDGHIWIVARHDISPGEEITFNYGYDLANYQEYPCHCGSPGCVGYMVAEEFFPVVRQASKTTEVSPNPPPPPAGVVCQ